MADSLGRLNSNFGTEGRGFESLQPYQESESDRHNPAGLEPLWCTKRAPHRRGAVHWGKPLVNDAEESARTALHTFFEAWNSADIDRVRATLNYPHVTFGPSGQLVVAQTAAEFRTDFARLREVEGWDHSSLDSVTVTAASETKVHCETTLSRYHADGLSYGSARVLYIITDHDGHWGMQCRSGMPDGSFAAGPTPP